MSETDPKPQLEIKSDADWKSQVRKEAAELDARRAREKSAASGPSAAAVDTSSAASGESLRSGGSDESGTHLPPADFTMLVTMFSTQAMVSLGVIPSPESGHPEQNLPLARHFIDLLGVLQEKTRRNLTGHEANLLESALHELRLAYVELSRSASVSPSAPGEATDTTS